MLSRPHTLTTHSVFLLHLSRTIYHCLIHQPPFFLSVLTHRRPVFTAICFALHSYATPHFEPPTRASHTSFDLHHSPYLPQHISPIAIFGTYVQYCNVLSFIIVHLVFSLSRCGRHAAHGHTLVARADLINPRPRAADHVCSRNADIASKFRAICWGR